MTKTAVDVRNAKRVRIFRAAWFAIPVVLVGLGSGTAHADPIGADGSVNSGGAARVEGDATFGEVRSSDPSDVRAHGEVRGSMKAVPRGTQGTRAQPYLPYWEVGAPIGHW